MKLFILTLLVAPAYLWAQQQDLKSYMTDYYRKKDLPAVVAGVTQNGNQVFSFIKGFADVENKVYVNDSTKFRVASISKSITGVAFLRLCQQGRAHPDTPITRYLPLLPVSYRTVTPRMILAHISGIRAYKDVAEFESKQFFPSTQSVVDYMLKDSLVSTPGSKYLYSSLAYNFVALLIEKVSGLTFENFVKEEVFKPAGMRNSGLDFQQRIIYNRARGYHKNDKRRLENAALSDATIKFAGGGVYSTLPDLLNFGNALLTGKLLNDYWLKEFTRETKLLNGEIKSYGMGIGIGKDEQGRTFYEHAGSGTGFSSLLTIYPEQNMVGVHIINCRDRDLNAPARELITAILDQKVLTLKNSLTSLVLPMLQESEKDTNYYSLAQSILQSDSVSISKEDWNILRQDAALSGVQSRLIEWTKVCLELAPTDANIITRAAEIFFHDNNNGTATQLARKALSINPKSRDAEELLGKISGSK